MWRMKRDSVASPNVSLQRLVLGVVVSLVVSARAVRRLFLTLATFLLRSATHRYLQLLIVDVAAL